MTTPTKILTQNHIRDIAMSAGCNLDLDDGALVARLIAITEQAVLQSPEVQARQWQPIETAPKNTEVLVWREDSGPFIAKLTDPYEVISVEEMEREGLEFPDDYEEWWSDAYGWQEGSERPTHWMPLPAPPADAMQEQKP